MIIRGNIIERAYHLCKNANVCVCVYMCVQRGIVTGGADKMVKFWDFELIKDNESGANK